MQIVKKYDYENYLASLLIGSADLRRTALALRAFNVELAQVRDLTKTDSLAQMRFQFWADIIDYIHENQNTPDCESTKQRYKDFPVAAELQTVLKQSALSKQWLRKMINVRREAANLSNFPFRTMEELEKYCDSCFASLYYLLDEKIVELSADKSAGYRISLDHIGSHLGKAQGLTNILRGVKYNAAARRCYIPNDILAKSKCTHEDFLRGNDGDAVSEAVFGLASQANSHLEHCTELIRDLKQATRDHKRIYLPCLTVKTYLDLLQRCHFRIFDPRLYQKNGYLLLKLWCKSKVI